MKEVIRLSNCLDVPRGSIPLHAQPKFVLHRPLQRGFGLVQRLGHPAESVRERGLRMVLGNQAERSRMSSSAIPAASILMLMVLADPSALRHAATSRSNRSRSRGTLAFSPSDR